MAKIEPAITCNVICIVFSEVIETAQLLESFDDKAFEFVGYRYLFIDGHLGEIFGLCASSDILSLQHGTKQACRRFKPQPRAVSPACRCVMFAVEG
jgi:hypothetical protein